MSARLDTDPLPAPGLMRFRLSLHDDDGDAARRFSLGGPVEVWLVASEQPVAAAGSEGRRMVTLPLVFPNYERAATHAAELRAACELLERTIELAQHAADHPIPVRDDGHRHVVRFERFARAMPFQATCEVCMETLVEDVGAWAKDRGLMTDAKPSRYIGDTNLASIKDEIERTFNREG